MPYKDLDVSCHGGETRLIYSDFLSCHHFVWKGWHFTWLTNTVFMFAVLLYSPLRLLISIKIFPNLSTFHHQYHHQQRQPEHCDASRYAWFAPTSGAEDGRHDARMGLNAEDFSQANEASTVITLPNKSSKRQKHQ